MSNTRLAVVGAFVAMVVLVYGCGRKDMPQNAAPAAIPAVPSAAQGGSTQAEGVASGAGESAASALPALARDLDASAFATALEGVQTGTATAGAGSPFLIDVRTPQEFAAGHIEGARNFDMSASGFLEKLADLPKDGQYLLYCRSGNRSSTALETMKSAGYGNVSHLAGGVGAWAASGKKLVN